MYESVSDITYLKNSVNAKIYDVFMRGSVKFILVILQQIC